MATMTAPRTVARKRTPTWSGRLLRTLIIVGVVAVLVAWWFATPSSLTLTQGSCKVFCE